MHLQPHFGAKRLDAITTEQVRRLNAENLPHVCFYRADAARSGGERAGLGLAIVKAMTDG